MTNMNSRNDLVKRCLLLAVALMILAFGIAFSIKASLGTSPISSVPYIVSLFTSLSVGNLTIIMHVIIVVLQILILRRRFELVQLLQLPVAVAFGYLTDFAIWATQGIGFTSYWQQWILCIIGILLVSIGVYLQVMANLVTLAVEGLVIALCKVLPIKFGNMKIILDLHFVIIASVLSILFMSDLYGVGAGTVVAAIFVGLTAKGIKQLMVLVTEKHSHYLSRIQPDHD